MQNSTELETRLQHIEYRLGIIEKLLDRLHHYKGEEMDMNAIRIEVLQDIKKATGDLSVQFDIKQGLKLYNAEEGSGKV